MDFEPDSYTKIRIPKFDAIRYADYDKSLIGDPYLLFILLNKHLSYRHHSLKIVMVS
jgi:hypothetical protein